MAKKLLNLAVEKKDDNTWTASCRWGRILLCRKGQDAGKAVDNLKVLVTKKLGLDWSFDEEISE